MRPFPPIRARVVFIGVIVIHPSSPHSELIAAYEKWLMAVMTASPLSGNHVGSPLWNSNSPFIPLQCLLHLIYPLTFQMVTWEILLFSMHPLPTSDEHYRQKGRGCRGHRLSRRERGVQEMRAGGGCRRCVQEIGGGRLFGLRGTAGGGEESLIELENTLITTVSHIPALNASHTIWATKRGGEKKENRQFQPAKCAAAR